MAFPRRDSGLPAVSGPSSVSRPHLSLFGVRIRIHLSWVIMAVFIAWSLASGSLPMMFTGLPTGTYWLMAVLIVVGLAVSIVLHELAHTLVGRAMGVRIDRITLFLFGGVAELREEPKRPGAELAMAIAGPAFSVVFGFLLGAVAGAIQGADGPGQLSMALAYLASLNLMLAIFNMVPAFPLDGGRVLRAIIWLITRDLAKATRMAAFTGEVLAILLIVAGVATLFTAGAAGGLWWIMIGLFLHGAARGARLEAESRAVFSGHAIGELMRRVPERVPAWLSLADFVDGRLLGEAQSLYFVVDGEGRWQGLVTPEDILRTPRDRWAATTMGEICTPAAEIETADVREDAAQVLERMRTAGLQRMPVRDADAVVGVAALEDLIGRFELWRRLGPASRAP